MRQIVTKYQPPGVINKAGEIFVDEVTGQMRVGDGSTVDGLLSSSGDGFPFIGAFTEAALLEIDTSDLIIGTSCYVTDAIESGAVKLVWNGSRFIPSSPITLFSAGAGWSRVFDGVGDQTRLVHLAVPIPRVLVHEATVLKISHYWSEQGVSTKNLILGINDTASASSFFAGSSNSGTGFFSVQEVYFTDGMIYPRAPNQTYGSGGSSNGPVTISVDFEQQLELVFYSYANAQLTALESVTLEYTKVEVL